MIRSSRRYDIELRVRDMDGGRTYGSVHRFIYTDEEGRDWVKINGEWAQVDDRFGEPHAFVQEFPQDMEEAA